MKLRQKIIVFATVPLVLALCIIAFTVYHHATELSKAQQEVIQPAFRASKQAELKSYVTLAKHSIAHLYEAGRADAVAMDAAMDAAKAILTRLDYSDDGYFFVYDLKGTLLVHSRRPELIGRNRLDYKDINGYPTIQSLISRANEGGGYVQYATEKPSTTLPAIKLTYVIPLPEWGWVMGTGIYLDDVENALAAVDSQVSSNNFDTMRWIGAIACVGMLVIIFTGLMLNIRERRVAQEEERARVARELHDSVCQRLLAIKLWIGMAGLKLAHDPGQFVATQNMLEDMADKLNATVVEVRGIAHDLYPEMIGIGLTSSLRQLAHEMSTATAPINFISTGETDGLPNFSALTLYRVAQAALTNSKNHAAAHQISMRVNGDYRYVTLTICDDGIGFKADKHKSSSNCGIGLLNMRQRLEDERVDGKLNIKSSARGTTVVAKVPRIPRNNFLINLWPLNRQ